MSSAHASGPPTPRPFVTDAEETPERRLLGSALAGDERAFRELVALHRSAVHAHCYRMLASLHDAEDAFQDTMLRAWRSLDSLVDENAFRAWLFRIATNVCLDALRRGRRRAMPVDFAGPGRSDAHNGGPDTSISWVEPFPDQLLAGADSVSVRGLHDPAVRFEQREAIELAFIAALQHLPPRQRAALVLTDVLGFKASQVAVFLDTTVVAVSSAVQRARDTLRGRLPDRSQQMTARQLGNEGLEQLAARFVDAFEAGDHEAILDLLTDDVTFEMPPYREWSSGRSAVAESWLIPSARPTGLRLVRVAFNAQLAFGVYSLTNGRRPRWRLTAIDVITIDGACAGRIVAFRSPEALMRCGLPNLVDEQATELSRDQRFMTSGMPDR